MKYFATICAGLVGCAVPVGSFIHFPIFQSRLALTSIFAEQDGGTVLYSDDDQEKSLSKNKRWNSLSPAVKERIIKEGQQRAIQNKKKREPSADKKRRMLMFYKKAAAETKRMSRVERPLPVKSDERIALQDLAVGEIYNGTVISLTSFGAYVDIGSECDGLLHVSQITRERFIEHPKQALTPGDQINVTLVRVSPALKKMHLSMLPKEVLEEEDEDQDDFDERIPLEDLATDDELWGEIKRVTSYGAYVEVGAVVQGWLHFMDHPEFEFGKVPSDFMKVSDRIRCWVSNKDEDNLRLKLTAIRPKDLPGPRREIKKSN
jgi:transcriptional accessory protein Tex/SPT6